MQYNHLFSTFMLQGQNTEVHKFHQIRLQQIEGILQETLFLPKDVATLIRQWVADLGGAHEHCVLMRHILKKRMLRIAIAHKTDVSLMLHWRDDFDPSDRLTLKKLRRKLHRNLRRRHEDLIKFRVYHRTWKLLTKSV